MAKEPELRRTIERLSAKAHGKVGPFVLCLPAPWLLHA
jgi:hypothetical protein